MELTRNGPFIQAACLCEAVLEERTGVISLIRIVDMVTHTAAGSSPPESMPPFAYNLKLVVMMKSGEARGRYEIKIALEQPSGLSDLLASMSVHLEGEEKGHNILLDVGVPLTQEGLHWFRVYPDEEPWTSLPLRVRYSRLITGAPPGQ
jgi:hypothetical protein